MRAGAVVAGGTKVSLTESQRVAIVELGSRGAGGNFDQMAMASLFAMGLIEVRTEDRRLMLTETGRAVYQELMAVGRQQKNDRAPTRLPHR
ncbi:MAG: hypothetical protein HY290_08420 [Planctomycetia bacterium]|nr:hypothetical protein [Planctomycetia bacterium]